MSIYIIFSIIIRAGLTRQLSRPGGHVFWPKNGYLQFCTMATVHIFAVSTLYRHLNLNIFRIFHVTEDLTHCRKGKYLLRAQL